MRLFTKLLSLLAMVVLSSSLFAQQLELQVKDIKAKEFPTYSGNLIVRNPAGIDTDKLIFTEGDSIIKANVEKGSPTENIYNGKEVLFLVLNHQAYDSRTRWYQSVITTAIENGCIKEGDSYAIQSFDCNRPEYNSEEKQLLFPKTAEFTNDANALSDQVNQIDLNKRRFISNCQKNSDIYGAIYEALEEFNKRAKADGKVRSIVVFSDDFSLVREIKEQGIIQRSKDYDIPIYGITYYQNINRKYGVEAICDGSYGHYYLDKSNNINEASNQLISYCDNMEQRASGYTYPFTFDSPFSQDGSSHGVQVAYNKEITGFKYDSPSMNIMEWVSANPLLAIGILVLVIFLIILIMYLRKKKKKREEEQEAQRQAEIKRMEAEQEAASLRAAQQDEEIKRMKDAERQKEELARQERIKKEKEAENALKLEQMLTKGNLPWFTFTYQGQTGSFEVNYPEFTVGREEENNYRINLPIVSRKHFQITFNDGKYTITDLQSSNGTVVNGVKITSTEIKHGDIISIGDVDLTFHI